MPSPQELARRAQDDELWTAYCQTEVAIALPEHEVHVVPVLRSDKPDPGPHRLHVLTACDPASRGDRGGDAEAMTALRHALVGLTSYPALGFATDGAPEEESLAVIGLTDDEARRLGACFGQVAVFAWAGETWSVLACATDRRTDLGWRLQQPSRRIRQR